ncbi:hypothetical protein HYV57_00510 [Candidatus Peregrinibacteria bacterium]|nr:hypothetical protein [Candidatus Peregrinibacteria bacterium]
MFIAQIFFRGSLEKGEKVEYIVHKHPNVVQKQMMKEMILSVLVPFIFYTIFPMGFMKWIFVAWMFIGILKIIYLCIDWYYDAWLITNRGIILSQWQGFFNKEWSRVEYQTVEEVSFAVKGFFPTILNYGELTIARFGSKPTVIKKAMNPKKAAKIIIEAQSNFMNDKSRRDVQSLKNILSEMIQTHP